MKEKKKVGPYNYEYLYENGVLKKRHAGSPLSTKPFIQKMWDKKYPILLIPLLIIILFFSASYISYTGYVV
ncbi:MAG: hypothetical protein ACI9P9_000741, partial [Patescibacteria group bacterium]